MTFKAMEAPPGEWLRRLRREDIIWLVKEHTAATVIFPWLPPRPGHNAGELILRRHYCNRLGFPEVWIIDGFGRGLDKVPLCVPCEGHLGTDYTVEQIDGLMVVMLQSCLAQQSSLVRTHDQLAQLVRGVSTQCDNLTNEVEQLQRGLLELTSRISPPIVEPTRERAIDLDTH